MENIKKKRENKVIVEEVDLQCNEKNYNYFYSTEIVDADSNLIIQLRSKDSDRLRPLELSDNIVTPQGLYFHLDGKKLSPKDLEYSFAIETLRKYQPGLYYLKKQSNKHYPLPKIRKRAERKKNKKCVQIKPSKSFFERKPCICENIPDISEQLISIRSLNMNNWFLGFKYLLLSLNMKCQMPSCNCNGYSFNKDGPEDINSFIYLRDKNQEILKCFTCNHHFAYHIGHVLNILPKHHMDLFLGFSFDLTYLQQKCESFDSQTNDIVKHICKELSNSLYNIKLPEINTSIATCDGPVTIENAVLNFLILYYSNGNLNRWCEGTFCAKILLSILDNWPIWSPEDYYKITHPSTEQMAIYNVLYNKWFTNCYLARTCLTLKLYKISEIFGFNFINCFFKLIVKELNSILKDKLNKIGIRQEIDFIIAQFPNFLGDLEMEITNINSSIWDKNFKRVIPTNISDLRTYITKMKNVYKFQ